MTISTNNPLEVLDALHIRGWHVLPFFKKTDDPGFCEEDFSVGVTTPLVECEAIKDAVRLELWIIAGDTYLYTNRKEPEDPWTEICWEYGAPGNPNLEGALNYLNGYCADGSLLVDGEVHPKIYSVLRELLRP